MDIFFKSPWGKKTILKNSNAIVRVI
jgi:hypothetical protein